MKKKPKNLAYPRKLLSPLDSSRHSSHLMRVKEREEGGGEALILSPHSGHGNQEPG